MIRCNASTGWRVGDFGLERLRCHVTVGVRSWLDARGELRGACHAPGHSLEVQRRFGLLVDALREEAASEATSSEARDDTDGEPDVPLAVGPVHESPTYRADMIGSGLGVMLR